ncbi:MAG: hypothetical protein JNL32_00675 [Candidatus Kapabacteria bacterium]|nr:hypothetical protein [Candidatus Kapabacteria bacterium]
MVHNIRLYVVLLFAVAILTPQLSAQNSEAKDEMSGMRQRIMDFKKMKLLEILKLSGPSADEFIVKYNDGQVKIDASKKAVDAAVKELQEAIKRKAPAGELTAKTDAAVKAEQAYFSVLIDRVSSLKSTLNPEQYAKLVAFEIKFPEWVQRIAARKAKQMTMEE